MADGILDTLIKRAEEQAALDGLLTQPPVYDLKPFTDGGHFSVLAFKIFLAKNAL